MKNILEICKCTIEINISRLHKAFLTLKSKILKKKCERLIKKILQIKLHKIYVGINALHDITYNSGKSQYSTEELDGITQMIQSIDDTIQSIDDTFDDIKHVISYKK